MLAAYNGFSCISLLIYPMRAVLDIVEMEVHVPTRRWWLGLTKTALSLCFHGDSFSKSNIHRVNTQKHITWYAKTQAPDIILFCNNKKAYIPSLYLNGRSVAKKPKYVWNMLDYNYSKYFRRTHDVQHQLKKRICYSALKKKFEKFEFFFQSA